MIISVQKDYNRLTVSIPVSDDARCIDAVKSMVDILEACGYNRESILDACEKLDNTF
jgi:hypothetical protein